ncbi:MAG: hypothetical protein FWF44_03395 [Defluviitaleaceae bacterium]|nr:hypothetical protein [Defluviitaleaceae bacterium]
MYTVIPKDERQEYTFEQLQDEFNGKWVYLINAVFTNSQSLLKATPVVVADSELEGVEDGIYDIYRNEVFGRKADADFTDKCVAVPSVFWSERI